MAIYSGKHVSLHYRRKGNGTSITFLHGVGSGLDVWDAVIHALDKSYAVLRMDLRGHGDSDKPPAPYKLDDFVQDLANLYDHLGIKNSHLVGFSLGGIVAQGFALAYPEKVNQLVLISTVAGRTPTEQKLVRERACIVEKIGTKKHAHNSINRWFTDGFQKTHPETVANHFRKFIANDPAAYAAAYRVLADSDLSQRLSDIHQSTLIITGEHDIGSTPRMAKLMHKKIQHSELYILPGLKHALLLEAPSKIANLIQQFTMPASNPPT